jgi:hypothetical protein
MQQRAHRAQQLRLRRAVLVLRLAAGFVQGSYQRRFVEIGSSSARLEKLRGPSRFVLQPHRCNDADQNNAKEDQIGTQAGPWPH